jgi:cyclic lactone autoinducer peptide
MLKEKVLKVVAKLGYGAAMKAGGTASQYGIYQAKEPKVISELRNSR